MSRPRLTRAARKRRRCIALDQNGRQCRRASDGVYAYHGESELYADKVTWVAAPFCFNHHGHLEQTHREAMREMDKKRERGR